jgi:hypothetical protein
MQSIEISSRGQTDMKVTWGMDWTGKLPLVLTSTVILGSESHWTHDHILLSHDSDGQCGNAAHRDQRLWPNGRENLGRVSLTRCVLMVKRIVLHFSYIFLSRTSLIKACPLGTSASNSSICGPLEQFVLILRILWTVNADK